MQVESLRDKQENRKGLLEVCTLERLCLKAFRSESITCVINRRLYLESPIQLQVLLILPYVLGSIVLKTIVYTLESTRQ